MDPSQTATGNWLTEDYLFWMDVWEFDALVEEETILFKRELRQAKNNKALLKSAMDDDAVDGGDFS